jgi:hypothetical protein
MTPLCRADYGVKQGFLWTTIGTLIKGRCPEMNTNKEQHRFSGVEFFNFRTQNMIFYSFLFLSCYAATELRKPVFLNFLKSAFKT